MMAAVIGFFSALPEIVSLISKAWTYLNRVSGNDPAGYLAQMGQAFSLLNAAQTQEEHSHAAKALADALAHRNQ